IPLPVKQKAFEPVPLTQRSQTLRGHDVDYTTPYVQTFTFGATRSLYRDLTNAFADYSLETNHRAHSYH
ncbi:MAG: hypothetical protein DMG14_35415, partial [Acidobacteria bacterium]